MSPFHVFSHSGTARLRALEYATAAAGTAQLCGAVESMDSDGQKL